MLILASTSKIRAVILRNAGVDFCIEKPVVDEAELKARHPDLGGGQLAMMLAEEKARSVASRHPGALVLGADQVLVCEGHIYDKPRSLGEAREHLQSLAGKAHQLVSALCICRVAETKWTHVAAATLHMRDLSPVVIDHYLAQVGDETLTSVGAYKLEGLGVRLFDCIDGDYFTILGLPLLPLLDYLRGIGELAE